MDDTVQEDDFELVSILYHGLGEDMKVFRQQEVKYTPYYYHLSHFRRRRDRVRQDDFIDAAFSEVIMAPDPRNKTTVLALANMSFNAYENRNTTDDWKPVPGYSLV